MKNPFSVQPHFLTAALVVAGEASAQTETSAWLDDGHFLAKELTQRHPNAFAPQTQSETQVTTLIGHPTGDRPSHFGEVHTFSPPNSKHIVHHSTKHFVHRDAKADTLLSDRTVARTRHDYVHGYDPIIETISEFAHR